MSGEDSKPEQSFSHKLGHKLNHLNFSLFTALIISVIASLSIVAVGYFIYSKDVNRKYDIARPGHPSTSPALGVEDQTGSNEKDPIDQKAINRKLDFLKKESKILDGLGNFEPEVLSDQNIGLVEPTNPAQ